MITPSPVKVAPSSPVVVEVKPTPAAEHTATIKAATPLPSATPTATPTPIIYKIEKGDTLLSIALKYQVQPDDIQTINGIEDPRYLQIGQQIIIPGPEPDQQAAAPPTPTPMPMDIRAVNFIRGKIGGMWCLGEVSNPGTQAVSEVQVHLALQDPDGVLLAEKSGYIQIDVVPPGKAVPFALYLENPPPAFAQYQLNVQTAVPAAAETRYYYDLSTTEVRAEAADVDIYRLSGQLQNTGKASAEQIRLVAVLYDSKGLMLAQRQAELKVNKLLPGAATPFSIDLTLLSGSVDHYSIIAQGLIAD